ncbi:MULTISPECIES: potassium transporter Kup [unclassified Anaeromyxobacter]|uniref:potassium transporter Kup n=1 Tax=unclassified Anaeromyxobacter TaxID=2620896 RepID=UPI001F58302C|nr:MULTISPECIES: potassium transporter Kup [unclassified Anaeromyxobacter]
MSETRSPRAGPETSRSATPAAAEAAVVATLAPAHGHRAPARGAALAKLALGALGVVYGDIGTSPLYSLKECFTGHHGVAPSAANVLGVLSLVFWAMTFVVTFKYLSFVMRADNRGEGGILALLALVGRHEARRRGRQLLLILGLFGAALLYGDGVITPAISVLGAVEGLTVAAPALAHWVVPVTVGILALLFFIQRRGTAVVGAVFGPVMLVWFACIAILGVRGILFDASILQAVLPTHAIGFFVRNGWQGFLVLGGVVLVITGGEALYADMGHFGKRPIRFAWLLVAMPALLLNYMGQGAILLHDPEAARNPFFLLVPEWALYPMIAIATAAAIVASQALISGAFSLTRQAVQLGYSPRVTIRHTSSTEIGQIYVPEVNALLGMATIALVLGFKTSSNLAAAYGIAVTGTMAITTLLFHRVARDLWRWPRWRAWPVTLLFLFVDVSFLGANIIKVEEGGWFPLAAAAFVFTLLSTWKRGREALAEMMRGAGLPLDVFLEDIARRKPQRVPGTAVFMTGNTGTVPPVLLHHLKHNKVLHERVVLASLMTEEIPSIPDAERVSVKELGSGFFQVVARYGFMETPDVPAMFASLPRRKLDGPKIELKPMETTYYLGRETLLPTGPSKMSRWRKRLFIIMARNAQTASAFFGLPPNRVVEMGAQIQL